MLLIIQFPLADIRQFNGDTGLLMRPSWPAPIPDNEFVRNVGIIRNRSKSGLSNWVGENEICTANQAIRFKSLGRLKLSGQDAVIKLLFRRFYSDGLAFHKFEIGFEIIFPKKNPIYHLSKQFLNDFLSGVIVEFPHLQTGAKECQLAYAGGYLAQLISISSISTKSIFDQSNKSQVTPSKPIIYVIENKAVNHRNIPLMGKDIRISSHSNSRVSHHLLPYNGINISTFIFSSTITNTRELRIMLLRIHAEIEVLKIILGSIATNQISIKPKSKESDLLQYYLNKSSKRILQKKVVSSLHGEFDFEEVAFSAIEAISPGTRGAILERLEYLDIRKNIFRKIENLTNQITINGNVSGSAIIIGNENEVEI